MEWKGIHEVEENRLDDGVDIGCEMRQNPRMSLILGFGKIANTCSKKLDEALFLCS